MASLSLSLRTFACSLQFYFATDTFAGWVPDFAGVLHSHAFGANEARWSGLLPSSLFFFLLSVVGDQVGVCGISLDFGKR